MGLTDETLASMLQGQSLTRGLAANLANEFQAIPDAPTATPTRKKRVPKIAPLPKHLVLPDMQVRPDDCPTTHLEWIGQFIVDEYEGDDLTIIELGDFWDMASLSSYDRGKRRMEGRRVIRDILAGNRGMDLLMYSLASRPAARRKKWSPRLVALLGNHEDRITRAIEDSAQLEGLLSLDLLNLKEWGWEVHDFRAVVELSGVAYSHFFYHPNTGRPYSGQNIDTRLKTIGHSFTMGHQQGLGYGVRTVLGKMQHGLVCGSGYLHDEDYKGPQGNAHWRGVVCCHQVEDGSYDAQFISLDYLCRRYEGLRLTEWMEKYA